jgi:hypothetical protein
MMALVPLVPVHAAVSITAVGFADKPQPYYVGNVHKGDTLNVTGVGVTAGATINIYWDNAFKETFSSGSGKLNSTTAEADGTWLVWLDVPEGLNGWHYIWAKDTSTGETAGGSGTAGEVWMMATLVASPSSGLPGDTITLKGYGYGDEEDIDSITDDFMDYLTALEADESPAVPETTELGTFTCTFKVPQGTDYENYTITATNAYSASDWFVVGASISLSDEEGPTGMVIEVNGQGLNPLGTIDEGDVTLDGVSCYIFDEPIDIDSDGDVKFEIVIPSVGNPGTYTLVVDDGTYQPELDFEVLGEAEIEATPAYGVQGAKISIQGFNFTQVDGEDVDVYIGATFIKSFETDNDGTFSGTITIPAVASDSYTLYAYQSDFEIEGSTGFRVGLMIVILTPESGPSGALVTLTGSGFTDSGEWNATLGDVTLFEDEQTEPDGTISELFFVPTVEPGTYTVTVRDVDAEIDVTSSFTVTHKTMMETDPLVAPNGYNVTIEGKYFSAEDGTNLDFVIFNSTDDWDMNVEYGHAAVETDEDGNFTGYWEVLDDETIGLGTYTINCTDDNDLLAQFSFTVVSKTVQIEPRKSSFAIGDTVAFNVESSFAQPNSYIEIEDPSGDLYWTTDPFESDLWIQVGTIMIVPFYQQTAGGNPMTLLDDAPLGTWTWVWYDEDDDEVDSGTFSVSAAPEDVLGEQIEDLNSAVTDLQSDITTVSTEVAAVRTQITNAINAANAAVQAANAATQAVNAVAQTASAASTAATNAANAATEAKNAANGLTTLVYGAIGASLVAALAAIVSLMQISRRIAG